MVIATVMYPKTEESSFDLDYYLEHHMPMVRARFADHGLEDVVLLRGTATLDGSVPKFELIGELHFCSAEHLQDALSKHGPEIFADIPKFTNVQPVVQVNEPI